MAQVNAGGVKGALLSKAINAKIQHYRKTGEVKHAIYDALVFRKVGLQMVVRFTSK
jgi:long-chain acyl-CoA synthetase